MTQSLTKNGLFLALIGLIVSAGAAGHAKDSSLQELIGKLQSSDPVAQCEAIDQLGARGAAAAEAVAPLTALLKDAAPDVRARAAKSLGKIGAAASPAARELASLLQDDNPAVCRQAVEALIAIRPGPKAMIPLFIRLTKHSDPGVQLRVLHAIAESGEAAVPELIEALKDDKATYWVCVVLRDIGPAAKAAVPALVEKLHDSRPDIRVQAILALGAMDDAAVSAVPEIAKALKDEHTVSAATFALGQLGKIPADAEQTIRSNAKSDDRFLSVVSHCTLARVHPEDKGLYREAMQQLVTNIEDDDPHVRAVAAMELAALPPAPEIAIPIWEKAVKDADTITAFHALGALAALGKPAVPILLDILENEVALRVEVASTLGEMGSAAAAATDALAKLVADEDLNVATEAVLALGKIGPAAKSAVPALCAAFEKEGEKNAHAIIFALGNIGPEAAAGGPQVLEAMKSKDKALAVIAASTFMRIHPGSAEAAAKAVPVLLAGLAESLPETRKAAAEALGELGPLARQAAAALQEAKKKDGVKAVREAAAQSLKSVRR